MIKESDAIEIGADKIDAGFDVSNCWIKQIVVVTLWDVEYFGKQWWQLEQIPAGPEIV